MDKMQSSAVQAELNNAKINAKMDNNNNTKMDDNNAKINGFQKTVVGLTESIKTVKTKVSENKTKLLAVMD